MVIFHSYVKLPEGRFLSQPAFFRPKTSLNQQLKQLEDLDILAFLRCFIVPRLEMSYVDLPKAKDVGDGSG